MSSISSRLFNKEGVWKKGLFWGLLLSAMLLRYGYYGFRYFPVADDNNMYGIFSQMSPWSVLSEYRMYTTRPAAAILDAFIISRFWDNMWLVLFFMVLLHFIACILVFKVFEKNGMKTGICLAVIFALFPLGNDATYWIAGSSRLVAGMFFTALSLYLFMLFIERRQKGRQGTLLLLAGFAVTNLLSYGFYEQIIAFSFIAVTGLFAVNFKRVGSKWAAVIPVVNIVLTGAFYIALSGSGNMAARGQLVNTDIVRHTADVFKRIIELLTSAPASMLKHGVINGSQLIINDGAVIYALLALALAAGIGLLYSKENIKVSLKANIIKLIIGAVLLIAPFAPFFALEFIWILFRNTFVSFIGIGLIAEALISIAFGKIGMRAARGILAGAAVFIFIVVNASDVHDYRTVYAMNREIVSNITNALSDANGAGWTKQSTLVFNAKRLYFTPASPHFYNCTNVDWALRGTVESVDRIRNCGEFLPIKAETRTVMDIARLDNSFLIGLDDDRNAFILKREWVSDGLAELSLQDGRMFGTIEVKTDKSFVFHKSNW